MARTKKSTKSKDMFDPYVEADVPDIMPFPDLARVATTKGDETCVPKLNKYQRSWILDVGIRDIDLPSLGGPTSSTKVYDQVKEAAFAAKAFQHQVQPQDKEEEGRLPALATAWKQKEREKLRKRKPAAIPDSDDSSDEEDEDEAAREGLLRGYKKSGWRVAIQRVISNKRTAETNKLKANKKNSKATDTVDPKAEATAMVKLLGLASYTGRDKFAEDRHDEIHEFSKTLSGDSNAGGKFRKAEALLWDKEDKAVWEAAAALDEDVDWTERQKLVPSGFKHMVNKLHTSGKFRPFLATMLMAWLSDDGKVHFEAEAIPSDIRVHTSFEKQYAQVVQASINGMYTWAEKPLKDYAASREGSAKAPQPVFPLTTDTIDDVSHRALVQTVTTYLEDSYEATFGSRDIPWGLVATTPDEYYDAATLAAKFPAGLSAMGLADLTRAEWDSLALALASVAGVGSSGFFRKAARAASPPPRSPTPQRRASPPPHHLTPQRRASPPARAASPPPRSPTPQRRASPPPHHLTPQRRASPPVEPPAPDRRASLPAEPPTPPVNQDHASPSVNPATPQRPGSPPASPPPADPLTPPRPTPPPPPPPIHQRPESEPPSEGEALRKEKAKATAGKVKPSNSWEYVEKSPVKAPQKKAKRLTPRDTLKIRGLKIHILSYRTSVPRRKWCGYW
ncbi:hypothetical protein B0H15DRAFT_805905 [Mycena belliarum]|uniref:Uncharacterized protein n=1 Tax=Mycena belliarum TaxID=1033014 RepID=A0AAD6XJZ2_9AGAR|nr:hypothetical protein B0H15DRAFT_805905 [Mycena belliae]